MNTRLGRRLQFIFALAYACFLIAGALPANWLPKTWRTLMYQFSQFQYQSARILPGINVFTFPNDMSPFQGVSACVEVEVRTAAGKVKVFDDFQCPRHKVKYSLVQDPLRIFYMSLANKGPLGTQATGEVSLLVQATAEYFCRKFAGETAIVRFSSQYQNLVNGVVADWRSPPQVLDCAILRPQFN